MNNKWNQYNLKAYKVFLGFVGLSNDNTSRNLFRLFQVATYSVLVIFVTNLFSFFDDNKSFGAFGDYFGGMLNPVLTFLTFMGLLITIVLQQKELRLTRSEIKTSSIALSEQAITQEKQRFENTFFSLFEQHNQIMSLLCTARKDKWSDGGSDLKQVYTQCTRDDKVTLRDAKAKLQSQNELVGHFYRTMYQLLKLIATKHPGSQIGLECPEELLKRIPVSNEEKFYSNLVRSVLSYEVTQLLAINCYSDNDSFIKFKRLIIRYQFLEHMPLKVGNKYNPALIESIDHLGNEAFGDSQFVKEYLATLDK
ncbi:putative phage abortive infection protein [Colwellia sp. MSW7]|uniref:Phage abortive infection protein n=1 Tax=Colwellia maritima TaxID=2912588 RepID=A0ABS9X128_9GAMM|nr:putative phage abortive infection protein [Colwellia maritima]MCI2283956.1 putative phage abortive infection protein [Colwellia maritima]